MSVDKVELVKIIIVRLSKAIHATSETHRDGEIWFSWEPLDVNEYLVASQTISVRFIYPSTRFAHGSMAPPGKKGI